MTEFVDFVAYPHMQGVELISVGMEWPASTGPYTCTFEQIRDIIIAANEDPLVQDPRIKLGHTSEVNGVMRVVNPFAAIDDAAPAFGRIVNLRSTNEGAVLLGDFVEVPKWLAESMPSAYPSRSAEPWLQAETPGGKRYEAVLTAVSLLGQYLPAVGDLEDLQRFIEGGPEAVAAATRPEEASVPASAELSVSTGVIRDRFNFEWAIDNELELDTYWWWARDIRVDPAEVIADDDEGGLWSIPFDTDGEDTVTFGEPVRVRETFVPVGSQQAPAAAAYAARRNQRVLASGLEKPEKQDRTAAASQPSDTSAAGVRPDTEEEATVPTLTQDQLRRLRELPEDATQEQIDAALAESEEQPEDEVTEPAGETEDETVEQPESVAASSGVRQIDEGTLSQLQADAQAGREAREQQRRESRDTYLNAALKAGKFPPARLGHYTSLFDADEQGTRELIDGLAEGLVPVDERGSAPSQEPSAASDSEHDEFMRRNFPHAARRRSHLTGTEA